MPKALPDWRQPETVIPAEAGIQSFQYVVDLFASVTELLLLVIENKQVEVGY